MAAGQAPWRECPDGSAVSLSGAASSWVRRGATGIAVLCAALSLAAGAQTGVVTILEGQAVAVDGARRFAVVAGQRVGARTLIETHAKLNILRVEWPDGSAADFGPDTRVMLGSGGLGAGDKRRPDFYLLQGWAKHSSLGGKPTAGHATPQLHIDGFRGVTLSHVGAADSFVFLESGAAAMAERHSRNPARASLKSGEAFVLSAGKWVTAGRLSAEQLRSVPRGLRESLPALVAKFAGAAPELRSLSAPRYADLAPWLGAEADIRRDFPRRFGALAQDAAFRKALAEHLSAHPEWEPVLYPERSKVPNEGAASAPR